MLLRVNRGSDGIEDEKKHEEEWAKARNIHATMRLRSDHLVFYER